MRKFALQHAFLDHIRDFTQPKRYSAFKQEDIVRDITATTSPTMHSCLKRYHTRQLAQWFYGDYIPKVIAVLQIIHVSLDRLIYPPQSHLLSLSLIVNYKSVKMNSPGSPVGFHETYAASK
ncbi:MAG: hypothetical protein MUC83_11180 [Pirellula sp.]|nr:hypothetical protein [Pirellula sp.]